MQSVFSNKRDALNSQDSEQMPMWWLGIMIIDHQWKLEEKERRSRGGPLHSMCKLGTMCAQHICVNMHHCVPQGVYIVPWRHASSDSQWSAVVVNMLHISCALAMPLARKCLCSKFSKIHHTLTNTHVLDTESHKAPITLSWLLTSLAWNTVCRFVSVGSLQSYLSYDLWFIFSQILV